MACDCVVFGVPAYIIKEVLAYIGVLIGALIHRPPRPLGIEF